MNEFAEHPSESEQTTFQVRLPKDLRDEFLATAKKKDVTAASLIRGFMRHYVKYQEVPPWVRGSDLF